MTRFLALDVGEARIGVAVSDTTGFLASPYVTLHVSRAEGETLTAIQRLINETEAEFSGCWFACKPGWRDSYARAAHTVLC